MSTTLSTTKARHHTESRTHTPAPAPAGTPAAPDTAPVTSDTSDASDGASQPGAAGTTEPRPRRKGRTRTGDADTADDMAVASFIMGLVGLLVFNIFLGPCALVLGGLALGKGTTRRGRALLGTALGAADLVVLAVLTTTTGTVSWSLSG